MSIFLADLVHGDHVVGHVRECPRCKRLFIARRSDAVYCGKACTMAVSRAAKAEAGK